MSVVKRRPLAATATVRTALALTVGFAIGLGSLVGSGAGTVVAVTGAFVLAWAIKCVQAAPPGRRALGSIGLLVGPALVAAGVLVATHTLLVGVLALAVAVVSTETLAGITYETADSLVAVTKRSGLVILLGGIGAIVVLPVLVYDVPSFLAHELFSAITASALVAFVWLQIGILLAGALAGRVGTAVDSLGLDRATDDAGPTVASQVQLTVSDVPPWYFAALVIQFVLASWGPSIRFVSAFLDSRPVVGRVVRTLLLSGVLQALVATVLVVLATVLVVLRIRDVVVDWAGAEPARTVSNAAGGLTLVVFATALAAVLLADVTVLFWVDQSDGTLTAVLGPVVGVHVAGLLALAGLTALFVGTGMALTTFSSTAWGFSAGGTLLFAGTLLAADAVSAATVVVGSAVALYVWHLGAHALDLERDLHGVAPTQRSEVVHATAAGVALAIGVVVALVVGYVAAPLSVVVPAERALAALLLVLVAVVAFGITLRR